MKCLQAHNLHWHKMLLLAHGGSHGTVSKRAILFIFAAGPESRGRWDESVKWGVSAESIMFEQKCKRLTTSKRFSLFTK